MTLAMRRSRTSEPPDLSALALEIEAQLGAVHLHVPVLQRGQAVALVLLGVLVAADADEGGFQQLHDGGQHFLPRQAAQREVIVHLFADSGQAFRESQHVMVFRALAHFAKARMVAVLLASLCIAPGRLDMAVRPRADPHVGPGGRNGKRLDAL